MHIPDGYLSPATCAVGFAIAIPTIAVASQRVQRTVKTRNVPTLAVLAAVSFLIMMFNVPIPDGTTAHAVGAVLDRDPAGALGRGDSRHAWRCCSRRCCSVTAGCWPTA